MSRDFVAFLFIYLPAFLDTGLLRENVHERDSDPMRGAIPTQSHTRKGWPHHRGLRPLLFSNSVVGLYYVPQEQISESAVRRDLRFFVLILED